jgi:hypothetical protein
MSSGFQMLRTSSSSAAAAEQRKQVSGATPTTKPDLSFLH